jgi:predicted DNA binding protein
MAEALESELTDRQTEILHTALLAGYFEWPRDSSAEDVAETVGITSSTLQYHLRNAQKTVFSRLFGQDL